MSTFSFALDGRCGDARAATITTPHGPIHTPIFMPVGTQGSVKALCPQDLHAAGAEIILANTSHLMLRPGQIFLADYGGLHSFMSWDRPLLTDSGGFQVFSLSQGAPRGRAKLGGNNIGLVSITEQGVVFKSYLDGSIHPMPPEESMAIQMAIGSDFIMALDVCPMARSPRDDIRKAMDITALWLKRCVASMTRENSRLIGIVQGGIHEDLRKEHVDLVLEHDLFGYAIGGLSVGENKDDMWRCANYTASILPPHKPRYLMGVGTPDDLLDGIKAGIDMFDCVMPTRNARNGSLFTHKGKVSIKAKIHAHDHGPLDDRCACYTCKTFSKAYLRHLFIAKEILYYRLASLHNISYYLNLVKEARNAILKNNFMAFYNERKGSHGESSDESHCEDSQ
jgi:queuine tRNA-ribosyltransferase